MKRDIKIIDLKKFQESLKDSIGRYYGAYANLETK